MDKLIPAGILLGIVIVGFISNSLKLGDISKRYEFTAEYRNKFITFLNELFENRKCNQQLYYELTGKVKEMQYELGADGVYAYVKDNLKGYATSNYQALVNFLPETRGILSDFDNSIMRMRYTQEAQNCDDMFVRHLGSLELAEKNMRKRILNPFSDFAEGIRVIVFSPILLLKWFGFISVENSRKIKKNFILKIINFIVTTIGFVSGIMAIIMGWHEFWELIKSFI